MPPPGYSSLNLKDEAMAKLKQLAEILDESDKSEARIASRCIQAIYELCQEDLRRLPVIVMDWDARTKERPLLAYQPHQDGIGVLNEDPNSTGAATASDSGAGTKGGATNRPLSGHKGHPPKKPASGTGYGVGPRPKPDPRTERKRPGGQK